MLHHTFPRTRRILATLAGALLVAATLQGQSTGPKTKSNTEPNLEQRLGQLVEELERQRQQHHVPGMAIAVVKDDKVILAHGFGLSNLEEKTEVTPETVFAIGSSTKAFTGALVGMLVEEGAMSWDDPVTKFLPYFALDIDTEDADATVTIRDLLAHRTGFTRMGILWAGNKTSREEVLRTATGAKPWSAYQGSFFYNNVTFMAAGVAAESAANTTWERLIEKRFFKPLNMKNSTTSVTQAQKQEQLSLGYQWKELSQQHDQLPMRPLNAIAPAGAINSNVLDMSQWLRFQLGHGRYDGKTLLSETLHQETWTPQITIGSGIDYGFGWMLRTIDGHRVVEHGGNIDGFSAQVTLIPDSNIGFVLLTNASASPLQSLASNLVVKALLGAQPTAAETTTGPSIENLEIYTGKYEANFGPFREAHFTVSAENDRLAIDVPGQTNYELNPPNAEGKWYFALTDEIAVSFDHDESGSIVGLKMYQSGMTFELPRQGVQRLAEIDLDSLQAYLGTYHLEEADKQFKVLIANQRLAVDVPGQMVFELHPPTDEGKWVFRVTDRMAISFEESEDGTVESMTLYEEVDEQRDLRRIEGPNGEPLPSIESSLVVHDPIGDLESYAGRYEANFGPFKETYFTVSLDNDRLAIDVPGQTNYELKPPNAEGKWYFVLTDEIAVSFDRDQGGSILGLKMYQSGMTFELPREGVEPATANDPADLQAYLGTYFHKEGGKNFTVLIANENLAVDVPGQRVFELSPPNDEGKWLVKEKDGMTVSFAASGEGVIESMTIYRQESQQRNLPRILGADEEPLPTVDQVFALRGDSATSSTQSLKLQGRVNLVHSGVSGQYTLLAKGFERHRMDLNFGHFGWLQVLVNEKTAWSDSNLAPINQLEGKFLRQARIENPLVWFGDFRPLFDSIRVLETTTLDDKKVHLLALKAGDLPQLRLYLDAENGDVLQSEMSVLEPTMGISVETVTRFDDYRDHDGQRMAFRYTSSNDWSGETVIEIDNVEFAVELDETLFSPRLDRQP